ncbi:MAG: Transcriptional regulator, ArsR family [Brockia lithotrophica]|uniref:Transcriptional regulator, ArsR family n=1 Tax=Brockia lithotrophica TaxID=933949 RepID=A0A2T5G5S5_9BACL|nr:winged helix-turn-helix transcriptional regulator [Brockia lithotrophica]PTQ51537.1 MAG: Transcriptional regulator, ArsR family [Brockia lithotrophica]
MSLTRVFKALGDDTRRRILKLLRERDLTAGEIAAHFAVSWPTISHHLSVLKQAQLVQDYRRGQNIYYTLNTTVFQEVVAWAMDFAADAATEGRPPAGDDEKGSERSEKSWQRTIQKPTLFPGKT